MPCSWLLVLVVIVALVVAINKHADVLAFDAIVIVIVENVRAVVAVKNVVLELLLLLIL